MTREYELPNTKGLAIGIKDQNGNNYKVTLLENLHWETDDGLLGECTDDVTDIYAEAQCDVDGIAAVTDKRIQFCVAGFTFSADQAEPVLTDCLDVVFVHMDDECMITLEIDNTRSFFVRDDNLN